MAVHIVCISGHVSHNGANESKSKMTLMFRRVRQVDVCRIRLHFVAADLFSRSFSYQDSDLDY